jgi:Holliday junction DNA helicase, RuvA subunit
MINAIRGELVSCTQNSVIVAASGVEYYAEVSTNTSAKMASLPDKNNVRLLTVMTVRQDFVGLYGFFDEMERNCFNELQKVPGIGPRQSLKILSSITVENLIKALDQKDISTLSKIPGVGPKTGQKLILQLRNVLVFEEENEKKESGKKGENSEFRELVESFQDMGFDKKLILRALEKIMAEKGKELSSMTHNEAESFLFPLILRSLS